MNVLVTGGTGYISSHTVVELLSLGHNTIIIDNLSNSNKKVLQNIKAISGKNPTFLELDMCDHKKLDEVFKNHNIDAVIHFAALKSPSISTKQPILYYQNNIDSTINLAKTMKDNNVNKVVFSSSAAVYGVPNKVPIKEEDTAVNATNPYGQTKVICERIWQDIAKSESNWDITLLRYFNPVGAHPSGKLGEDPSGIPNNLVPYISQVAVGKRESLEIFGDDYKTEDGTGVRDYIHIMDLVDGHIAALNKQPQTNEAKVYNLGTGKGYSVFAVIKAFEKASGKKIPFKISQRRQGDVDICYADPSKAFNELGWKAKKSLNEMCQDAWRWQSKNPEGYSVTNL